MTEPRRARVLTLAGHEYRAAVRSRLLVVLVAILVAVTVASVYIGAVDYRSQLADYRAYLDAAQAGGIQQVPPSPLALLSLLRGAMEYLEIIGAVIAITLGYLSVSRGTSQPDPALDSLPAGHPGRTGARQHPGCPGDRLDHGRGHRVAPPSSASGSSATTGSAATRSSSSSWPTSPRSST